MVSQKTKFNKEFPSVNVGILQDKPRFTKGKGTRMVFKTPAYRLGRLTTKTQASLFIFLDAKYGFFDKTFHMKSKPTIEIMKALVFCDQKAGSLKEIRNATTGALIRSITEGHTGLRAPFKKEINQTPSIYTGQTMRAIKAKVNTVKKEVV